MAHSTADKASKGARRRGLFGRFVRDRRAVGLVEFGIVAVPFLGLLLAIFETGFVYLNSEGLEAAVQDAARNIMTGQAQSANVSTASSFVSTYMCPSSGRILPSFIDCSKLIVDVRAADSFSTADTSRTFYRNPSTQQFCPGGNGKIIVVRVAYPMPVFLPVIAGTSTSAIGQITAGLVNDVPGNNGAWAHLLVGTAVFQNEPFAANTYTAPSGCAS